MKQYTIKNSDISVVAEIGDKAIKNLQIKYADGCVLFDGIYIILNSRRVDAVLTEFKAEANSICMTLCLDENTKALYSLSIKEKTLCEQVFLQYREGLKPDDFEIIWTLPSEKTHIMPIPFGNHDEKPVLLNIETLRGNEHSFEGVVFVENNKGFAVAKQPSDREPVWIKVLSDNGNLLLGAASMSANRGFCDVISSQNGWSTIDFHPTQYLLFKGELEQGFYTYRKYMADCGVTMPDGYNPPVNYCIYYECSRLDKENSALNGIEIRECHSMNKQVVCDMADIAKSLYCNLVYLDQGWDTHFGSLIWDEERLGTTEELVARIKEKGLDIGILVEEHSSTDGFSDQLYIKGTDGNTVSGDPWHKFGICACSEEYGKIRLERLKKLSDAGIAFFSYDFHNYTPCYSNEHGHSIPSTQFEHACSLAKNQALVKEICKGTLIESHDWQDAGIYYYPVYMFGNGHHERWGFEYMWHPMEDYRSGRLHNLYYYNLAYEKPMYMHMNLSGIGDNAEVFWYYASTIRHLGLGNYSELALDKQQLIKKVMRIYSLLRDYFAIGEFKGKGPLAHMHILKDRGTVINLFDDGKDNCGTIHFTLDDLGLKNVATYKVWWGNATIEITDDGLTVTADMQKSDSVVIELKNNTW